MKTKPSLIHFLLILAGIAALVPVLISTAYFHFVVGGRLYEQSRKSVDSLAQQIVERVESQMVTLNNTAYYLMANDLAQQVMEDGQGYLTVSRLEQQIDTLMTYNDAWSNRFIHALYLFRQDGIAFATGREGAYAGVRARNLRVSQENPDFSSTRTLLKPDWSDYAYYVQDYYQIDTQQKLGRLVIEVDPGRLFGQEDLEGFPPGTCLLLSGSQGMLLARGEAGTGGEEYHVSLRPGRYEMQLDVHAPRQGILSPVTESRTAYLGLQVLILAVTLAGILYISRRLRPQSAVLLSNLSRLAEGDFTVKLPGSRYQEYDTTARAFNRATQQLGKMFEQAAEDRVLLSQAEYHMLESQINPHFIMNVLETINMRCRMSGQQDTAELVVNLGNLLRGNVLHKHQQKITLEQELLYVRYYLTLQQARFEQLSSEIEVEDDSMLRCLVPKLTLQPLVENCFVHGLEDSGGAGHVSVSCWEEESMLVLRVTDDGRGFDVQQWEQGPGPDPRERTGARSGIALKNIRRRIELLYGPPYGLRVSSEPGKGTSIQVWLPAETGESAGKENTDASCAGR